MTTECVEIQDEHDIQNKMYLLKHCKYNFQSFSKKLQESSVSLEESIQQLQKDIHRLTLYFEIGGIYALYQRIRVRETKQFEHYIQMMEDYYKINIDFLYNLCNQIPYGFCFAILSNMYSCVNSFIYVIDNSKCEKIIKVQFLENSIYISFFSKFDKVHISENGEKKILETIDYHLYIHFHKKTNFFFADYVYLVWNIF